MLESLNLLFLQFSHNRGLQEGGEAPRIMRHPGELRSLASTAISKETQGVYRHFSHDRSERPGFKFSASAAVSE